jgi:hypothetical protein
VTRESHGTAKERDTLHAASVSERVDPLDALEEKWRTEPGDAAEWERRAMRALGLARRWRSNAVEWEESARKEASRAR